MLDSKNIKAYLSLVVLIICGLAVAAVTASKVVHIGINFPFSNIVFSIFTYPIVDCICEIWGKKIARQAVWLALASQLIIVLLLQLSIISPHAAFWPMQREYQSILSTSGNVVIASILAFITSQILLCFTSPIKTAKTELQIKQYPVCPDYPEQFDDKDDVTDIPINSPKPEAKTEPEEITQFAEEEPAEIVE